ncbi:hypothetical protein [Peribacillus simplex]|uniref:hypothetical protein n=1 Tax=Peribacillus simplex TaxID=1478 RepID=UPI0015953E6D|nr:hypothetical protein [Peribacillus simplex]
MNLIDKYSSLIDIVESLVDKIESLIDIIVILPFTREFELKFDRYPREFAVYS